MRNFRPSIFDVTDVMAQFLRDLSNYWREVWSSEWLPISKIETAGWMLFFLWFLWYAMGKQGGDFAGLDAGNAVVHEGGHALFSYFPEFITVAGGTILELLVPLLLALAFYVRRQPIGYTLLLLVTFENLLYVSKYMSDARAMALDYIAIGVGAVGGDEMDPNMHDWHYIFSHLGVLDHDTQIAAFVFRLAWVGMIGCISWFAYRCYMNWTTNLVE